jgi:hypothetical protein
MGFARRRFSRRRREEEAWREDGREEGAVAVRLQKVKKLVYKAHLALISAVSFLIWIEVRGSHLHAHARLDSFLQIH